MSKTIDTVLIVEDEQVLADQYANVLDGEYRVITTYSGAEALESVTEEVDAALLDRKMPRMSGAEVLSRLRDRGHDYPIAMVTAVTPDWDIVGIGFDDYLRKPVDMTELREAVKRLGALSSVDRQIREYVRQSVKQAALEGQKDVSELESNESFRKIKSEVANKNVGLEDVSDTLSQTETELIIKTISRNLGPANNSFSTDR